MDKPLSSRVLRIGIDARELLGDRLTGIGRYLHNFLVSRTRQECPHQFVLYGNQHTVFPSADRNLTCHRTEERSTFWWDQVILSRQATRDHLDIFFSPYDKAPIFTPCPMVLTVHDLLFLGIPDRTGFQASLYNALYMAQRWAFFQRATRILTVSEHSRQDLIRTFCVSPDKVSITYNGVSNRFRPDIDDKTLNRVKHACGIASNYILYVGNFKPHKNVSRLIQAYAALSPARRATCQLVLAGHTDRFRERLQSTVAQSNINDQILFPGGIPEEDLPALYAGAQLFVFPSLSEGFGLPALEAMACGVPVVATRATSIPEVVGNAGILVNGKSSAELQKAIETLLNQPNLRRTCSEAGLIRAKTFTLEQTAQRILLALENSAKDPHERI